MAATVLRLQRRGKKKKPFYHVIVADRRAPRDGKYLEKIGTYDPNHKPSVIHLDEDRAQFWYQRGAMLSDPVKALIKAQKIVLKRTAGKDQ